LSGLSLAAALLTVTLSAPPGEAVPPAVVLVSDGCRFGAGIVWDAADGLVLTALHVVEGMAEIRISLGGGAAQPARIVDREPALDLALLRASGPLGRAASVRTASAPPARGDPVRLLGYPGGRAAAAHGTILEASRRFAGSSYLEIAGRAEPGASGGAVIDAHGAVVGIVDLVLTDRGSTLAVPIEAALARFARIDRLAVAGEPLPIAWAGGPEARSSLQPTFPE
jgi:S1-C subfamily serine protease